MSERDDNLALVSLGFDVAALRGSAVGRHLFERARDERAAALEGLAYTDPNDAKAIRDQQDIVHILDTIMRWLDEAEQAGANAETLLREQDSD